MRTSRLRRLAATLGLSLLLTGVIAGTAVAGQVTWQQVWDQIRPLLSDPGTINAAENPVHWTKLKGVPGGLADGLDNGVDRAGFGLKKNLVPTVEFAVDPSKVQRRVTGACPAGQAVQSVGADGSVTCTSGAPVVYHGWDVASGGNDPIGNDWSSVGGGLDLPAGTWSLVAKFTVGGLGIDSHGSLNCRLDAWDGATSYVRDETTARVERPSAGSGILPLVLTGVFSSAQPWRTAVVCRDGDTQVTWREIDITATQVSELHQQQLG